MRLSAKNLKPGQSHQELLVADLTRTQIVQFAGASGDFNPLHSDGEYAVEAAGYKSIFAHGMLTAGMTARLVTDFVGDGELTHLGFRFLSPVWPGDTLNARLVVDSIDLDSQPPVVNLSFATRNQDNVAVISGYARALIDP